MREYFDVNILPKYIENKTCIFGICRDINLLQFYLVQNYINIFGFMKKMKKTKEKKKSIDV